MGSASSGATPASVYGTCASWRLLWETPPRTRQTGVLLCAKVYCKSLIAGERQAKALKKRSSDAALCNATNTRPDACLICALSNVRAARRQLTAISLLREPRPHILQLADPAALENRTRIATRCQRHVNVTLRGNRSGEVSILRADTHIYILSKRQLKQNIKPAPSTKHASEPADILIYIIYHTIIFMIP